MDKIFVYLISLPILGVIWFGLMILLMLFSMLINHDLLWPVGIVVTLVFALVFYFAFVAKLHRDYWIYGWYRSLMVVGWLLLINYIFVNFVL